MFLRPITELDLACTRFPFDEAIQAEIEVRREVIAAKRPVFRYDPRRRDAP